MATLIVWPRLFWPCSQLLATVILATFIFCQRLFWPRIYFGHDTLVTFIVWPRLLWPCSQILATAILATFIFWPRYFGHVHVLATVILATFYPSSPISTYLLSFHHLFILVIYSLTFLGGHSGIGLRKGHSLDKGIKAVIGGGTRLVSLRADFTCHCK